MAKCKNCINLVDAAVNISSDGEHNFKWCHIKDDCPDTEIERECDYYEVMTQADRIRNMTDEELTEMIGLITEELPECTRCPVSNFDICNGVNFVSCERSVEKWLQSPVEV